MQVTGFSGAALGFWYTEIMNVVGEAHMVMVMPVLLRFEAAAFIFGLSGTATRNS